MRWGKKKQAVRSYGAWSWPDELERAALQRIGEATLDLLRDPERWVYRRVERVSFKDRETTRHQTSIDFSLPLHQTPVATTNDEQLYVAPLFLLAKTRSQPLLDADGQPLTMAPYSNIDVADHQDHRLPLLTRSQSNQIAVVALLTCAREALGTRPTGLLRQQISLISTTDGIASPAVRQALEYVLDSSLGPHDERRKLRKHEVFPELAHTLARYSPIVCLFPELPAGRSIVKIAYDEPITSSGLSMLGKGRLRRSLGWKSELLFVRLNELGAAQSYHLEVTVPPELELNEIGIVGTRYALSDRDISTIKPKEQEYYVRQVERTGGGHIYIPDPKGRRVGAAWVKLRARRRGFLQGALFASIVTTAVLSLAAFGADHLSDESVGSTKSDAATAILLVLPSLLAAYIARPGEHAITSRMLRFVRLALAADGSLPFLAAFRLLIYRQPKLMVQHVGIATTRTHCPCRPHIRRVGAWLDVHFSLQTTWTILACASAAFIVLFAMSCALPRHHGKSLMSVPSTKY